MANPYYTASGIPATLSRGASSSPRLEFAAIATGFDAVYAAIGTTLPAAIALKGNITNQTWLGNHQFPATTYGVTAAFGASGTAYATLDYVNATTSSAVLPGQTGKDGKFLRTDGTTADFSELGIKGADIASAGTLDLTSADGDFRDLTGTTTVTAITMPSGAKRTLRAVGAVQFTNGASLKVQGAANYTTAADDILELRGDASGVVRVTIHRANGHAVAAVTPGLICVVPAFVPAAAPNIDLLSAFSSAYDSYLIVVTDVAPSSAGELILRLANAGVVDAAANYRYTTNVGALAAAIDRFQLVDGDTDTRSVTSTFWLHNVNSVNAKSLSAETTYDGGAAGLKRTGGGGMNINGSTVSGLRLYWGSGNNFLARGTVEVWALSKT